MELKSYQEQAIRDLQSFLDFMNREASLSKAYAAYWESKDVPARPPYCNRLPGVPHICFKVPTGGEERPSWRRLPSVRFSRQSC